MTKEEDIGEKVGENVGKNGAQHVLIMRAFFLFPEE